MQSHFYSDEGNRIWGKPYRLAFFVWRRMPGTLRSLFSQTRFAKKVKIAGRDLLARFAGREDLYNREYYFYVDAEASKSAPLIVNSALSRFAPKRVIDVGCGTGALLAAFRSKSVPGVGLEYSSRALKLCEQRGLDVYRFDIERDQRQDLGRFDLAICFEVAEHVSARSADPLVDLLVSFAPTVIFTAATPGQGGGADHINEQPHEYWISKFERRGYTMLREETEHWRSDWSCKGVAGFYAKNIMVFQKL